MSKLNPMNGHCQPQHESCPRKAELDTAKEENERLASVLEEISLMGNTPSCKKAEQAWKGDKP